MANPTNKLVLFVCLLANALTSNSALIVSPRPAKPVAQTVANIERRVRQDVLVARIRSTRRADVESVADLLSSAIAGDDIDAMSWKTRVERLRIRSSVKSTLDLRVRVIQEGKNYLSQAKRLRGSSASPSIELCNLDHLRCLWSQDSFRNKIEQAAELSSEPHPWEDHNFALAPDDPCWLRHEMITAEDIATKQIVGFCEIAMLRSPAENGDCLDFAYGDDYCTADVGATIANLVVSPYWRRRGVARGLVKSAERLVQRKWKCDELGLYVEKQNQRAMNLYSSVGYQVKSSLAEKDAPVKWFMSKQV